jgi:hypothetical protein
MDVSAIKDRLAVVESRMAKQGLVYQASLALSDFKSALPDLRSSLADARETKLAIPAEVLNNLKQKLLATPENATDYWPAAAELISYHSSTVATTLTNDSFPGRCFVHDNYAVIEHASVSVALFSSTMGAFLTSCARIVWSGITVGLSP